MTEETSPYEGLLDHDRAGDLPGDAHWAFGTDFEDPLAGVDTTVPDGVARKDLAAYCLMLGDDALVLSHRLSQWCSRGPDLEDDIALSNIALDHLGQSRLLLARAAAADPSVVPVLPDGSPVPAEDALAFFRDAPAFLNVRMVESANGDFAQTVVRLLLVSVVRLAIFQRLTSSRDAVLAAVAAKGAKELRYHRDYAARWVLTLAQGTDESRERVLAGLTKVWPHVGELLEPHDVEQRLAAAGVAVDPSSVVDEVEAVLRQVLAAADIPLPERRTLTGMGGRSGRDGVHTEALSRVLAEMQVVARAHPMGRW